MILACMRLLQVAVPTPASRTFNHDSRVRKAQLQAAPHRVDLDRVLARNKDTLCRPHCGAGHARRERHRMTLSPFGHWRQLRRTRIACARWWRVRPCAPFNERQMADPAAIRSASSRPARVSLTAMINPLRSLFPPQFPTLILPLSHSGPWIRTPCFAACCFALECATGTQQQQWQTQFLPQAARGTPRPDSNSKPNLACAAQTSQSSPAPHIAHMPCRKTTLEQASTAPRTAKGQHRWQPGGGTALGSLNLRRSSQEQATAATCSHSLQRRVVVVQRVPAAQHNV